MIWGLRVRADNTNVITEQRDERNMTFLPLRGTSPRKHNARRLPPAGRGAIGALAVLAIGTWVSSARADTVIAGDLDLAFPIDQHSVNDGLGFGVRLGERLTAKPLVLTGEIGGSYYHLRGTLEPHVYRGLIGARLGVGSAIRPVVFGHLGIARATFSEPPAVNLDRTAFAWDAGVGLDFTLLPLLNLGVHGAYNSVGPHASAGAFKWATLGANIELVF